MADHQTVHRGVAAVAGVLLLAGVTGCGSATGGAPEDPAPKTVAAEGKAVGAAEKPATPPRMINRSKGAPGDGLLAHMPGTLLVTDRNCLGFRGDGSKVVSALSWAHGWTAAWENGKAVVRDEDGEVFAREGDRMSLGGGTSDQFAGHPCADGTVWHVDDYPPPSDAAG
ncbi:hypothetical protein [Streptomyces sp. CC208A]|uniref:hypothetical protein n=1 Tax=Streptomyces sp. CC208A TaxID=3044573 RepID=UPI0024A89613|nr:hypothetical protein [Streptomyces sp. CC208A]